MSERYYILGQQAPPAATLVAVYIVPDGKSAVISTVSICNRDASATSFRLAFAPAGAADAVEHYAYYDLGLPAQNTFSLTQGQTLRARDEVRVYAAAATVSVTVWGAEFDA